METIYKIYKVELKHEVKNIRDFEIYEGITRDLMEGYPQDYNKLKYLSKSYVNALNEFDKYETHYKIFKLDNGGYVVYITEYYLEEEYYPGNINGCSIGEIWHFSKIKEST